MAEPDNGNAPYRKPHNQGEHDEAQRFQRSDQDGPPAPRSTSHMFSEAAAVWPIRPEPGQPDPRPVWDPEDALSHISPLFAALRDICPDGTMLAEDRQALAYSLVHSFHLQAQRLTRSADDQKKALGRASRGELADEQSVNELEATLASYKDTATRAKAFERISSAASAAYKNDFGEVWAPAKSDFTLPGSPTVGRILTPSKVRKSRSYLSAQRTRPSALAERAAKYGVPDRLLNASGGPTGPALYQQWRTDWQALRDRAAASGISVSRIDGYREMHRRARDLAERPDLPHRADIAIATFLAKTDDSPSLAQNAVEPAKPPAPAPTHSSPAPGSDGWDAERATRALRAIITVVEQDILAEDTQMRDEIEPVFWSLTNCFHKQTERLSREIADLDASPATRTADVSAYVDSLAERLAPFEILRDYMVSTYTDLTLKDWTPKPSRPSPLSPTIPGAPADPAKTKDQLRDAIIDPSDAKGPLVAVSGHRTYEDVDAIYTTLNAIKAQHPDMVLLHGGAEGGAVRIAQTWARNNGVDQVLVKPVWPKRDPDAPAPSPQEKRQTTQTAIKARNEEILALNPVVLLSFDAPGHPEHIAMRAERLRIPVRILQDPALPPKPRHEPAPSPDPSPAAPPWEKPPPAVLEYEAFLHDWTAHRTEARAAGVHPLDHRGADLLKRRATNLRAVSYLPESARASIETFCQRVKAFYSARNTVEIIDQDLTKQASATLTAQVYAPPHPMSDGPLLHRSETRAYAAWAERTDAVLADHARFTADSETYAPHLDPRAVLGKRIAANAASLTALRAADTGIAPAEALIADLHQRSLAVARDAHREGFSWIDHPNTHELLRHAELLAKRDDAGPSIQNEIAQFLAQYETAVEKRQDLDRIDARLHQHLDLRETIRNQAAEQGLHSTEHPEYEAWSGAVDGLRQAANDILLDRNTYGDHLNARPALAVRIRGTLENLVLMRDQDVALARALPPLPSPTPERTVTPEPAPLREPVPAPEPAMSITP